MAKLTQGTTSQNCGTCGASQFPDGPDRGLCFDPRHKSKRAKLIRDTNVCPYWHPRHIEIHKPTSLQDRIVAVLVFANGGASKSCRAIASDIEREFSAKVCVADVARMLEHMFARGRVTCTDQDLSMLLTWVGRYQRILNPDRPIEFGPVSDSEARLRAAFPHYCADVDKARAGRAKATGAGVDAIGGVK